MNKLSNVPAKLKVFLLVIYTLIIFVVSLLIIKGNSNKEWFLGYGSKPYDENIMVNLKLYENRKSAIQNRKEYESSTYNAYTTITRVQDNAVISNIKVCVNANTIENEKKSADSGTTTGSITTSAPYVKTISSVLTKSKTVTDGEVTKVDETPVKLFIKVNYCVGNDVSEIHELKYCADVTLTSELENLAFESKEINKDTATKNGYIKNDELTKDPFDMEISKRLTTSETTADTSYTDSYKVTLKLNTGYLGDKGMSYGTRTVYNFMPEIKVEVYGKAKNDASDEEEYFSNYILLSSWYGVIEQLRSVTNTLSIDEEYDVEEIYIVTTSKFNDGTSLQKNYKVNVSDLLTY